MKRLIALTLSLSLVGGEAGLMGRAAYAGFSAVRTPAKAHTIPLAPAGSVAIGAGLGAARMDLARPVLGTGVLPTLPAVQSGVSRTGGASALPEASVLPALSAQPQAAGTPPAPEKRSPGALSTLRTGTRAISAAGRNPGRASAALGSLYIGETLKPAGAVSAEVPAEGTRVLKARLNAAENPGEDKSSLRPAAPSALRRFGDGARGEPPRAAPVTPETHPELFRPKSSRVGIGPVKYVWWNAGYKIMQWFNLTLARDPNRRVSWDKWPKQLGLLYLLAKIRWLRSDTLTDPYDYAATDNEKSGPITERARIGHEPDGKWVADDENPKMGAKDTRFSSNIPPKKVRPDVENMMRELRDIARLKHRRTDPESGKEIVTPAGILNVLAQAWIQFQFHNFGGNTKRRDIKDSPHVAKMEESDRWPQDEMKVDRTLRDPTRVDHNGRPTPVSERTHHWIQAQIYGTDEAELARLRSFENGHMRFNDNGMLPEDPEKPGIDLTGFNNNYNVQLAFLHWIFTKEHNAIADHYRYFHPDWDDEKLFLMARKANVAQIARIHTVEWTMDLLQHPTLQLGMHADWYGLIGQKLKLYIMRLSFRRPWIGRLLKPLTDNDTLFGMPGSRWEHHDGPFQVPKQFRMVYRLHEMILGRFDILEPGTERRIDRIELLNFVHENTRPIIEKFGYDVLAYSFVKKSAGALVLHNFPKALTEFKNQQNGELTDLAMLDLLRERTDGTGTYNEFRRSVGEPPVKTFLELTGGDAELAKEISVKYDGDIEAVDAGIGILAEPRPEGFALSFTQFYQFVLNAPRRVKSNRHLTEYFTYKDYGEGMDWVEHGGGMLGAMMRHLKDMPYGRSVVDSMEGVVRPFAPWKDTETYPARLLAGIEETGGGIVKANLRTLLIGALGAGTAVLAGALSPAAAGVLTAALALPATQFFKRMLAWRHMQKVWQRAYTDRRSEMWPTFHTGVEWARRSARLGRLTALASLGGLGYLAWTAGNPVTAGLFALAALSALPVLGKIKAWSGDMALLKIALQNRLRDGFPNTPVEGLPGDTALAKRYWFLASDEKGVAKLGNTYRRLRDGGLPAGQAFMTAALSHFLFGRKSQRGLSWTEKGQKGVSRMRLLFPDIYIPNLIQAQGRSSSRVYAPVGNGKGVAPGDLDMEEFERMFRKFAPGRDYMTAYDMSRMREGNRVRDREEGRGSGLSRWFGQFAAKRRAEQLLDLFADRIVMEDNKLVPAVSRETLLRFYQGAAQYDLLKERRRGETHHELRRPAPAGKAR